MSRDDDSPIGIAIIGPGAIADYHASALRDEHCELLAVVGSTADEAAEFANRHGIAAATTDIDAVLADPRVGGVLICTPSDLHAEHTLAALSADKHVLCEIPIGMSLEAVHAVERASCDRNRHVMVAHTMRFWEPVRALKTLVESGRFEPRHIIVRSTMLRQRNEGWTGRSREWVDDVLWHHGAHAVDTALYLLDDDVSSVVGLRGPDWEGSKRHMDVGIVLATASGRLATIALSFHSRVVLGDYVVAGEDMTYEVRDSRLYSSGKVVLDCSPEDAMQRAGIRAQDHHFIDALRHGTAPRPSVSDVLPAMSALDRAHRNGRAWFKSSRDSEE